MQNLKPLKPDSVAIARKPDGNPDGKGLSGFLLDWRESAPRSIVAKPQRQVLAEFFTSMLVLSAAFKYRPAVGVENYLYWMNGEWSLSLVAPAEWSDERRASFAGTCVLERDMTWTIIPAEGLAENTRVADAIGRFYDAFAEMFDTDLTLEEILPIYVGRLPYHQRLLASALSRSIRATVTLGGQTSANCRQWFKELPARGSGLLSYGG